MEKANKKEKKEEKVEIIEAEIEEVTEIEEVKELIVKSEESLSPNNAVQVNSLSSFSNMEEMLSFSKVLVDSKLVPFQEPEQVATIVLQGKELGLNPVTSIFNIYYIEGKPSLSVHVIAGLLRRDGISFKTIEDSVLIDAEGSKCKRENAVTRRTTVRFYYKSKIGTGKNASYITIEEDSSFTWADAVSAGLDKKNNWVKYPKPMLYSRAFSIGARRVAPNTLMGLMEVTEMADATNTSYSLDENGNLKT